MKKPLYGRIAGWGAYVPERIVTNQELAQTLDTSDDWIVQRTGIRARHIAAPDETTSSMAVAACRAALAQAELLPEAVDLIIVATSTPDYLTPPVSSQIQAALGGQHAPAFVVVTGCTGFVYSLVTAYQFIQSGAYRTVLVVGVELLSRFVDWQDRATCVLFGDGAGAVVITATEQPCGLLGFHLGSDGRTGQHIILPAGGSARPFDAQVLAEGGQYLRMNGPEVYKFATRIIGPACHRALAMAEVELSAVDWIVPHQANLRIIQAAAKEMKLPLERFLINIDRYANTSAASIPLAIAEALANHQIAADQTLLLASFGAGMTWATALLQPQPR